MTEQEWLEKPNDPGWQAEIYRGKVAPRKVRLFAVACGRRVAHLLPPDLSYQRSLEVAERYADRLAPRQELLQAHAAALAVANRYQAPYASCAVFTTVCAAWAATRVSDPTRRKYVHQVVHSAATALVYANLPPNTTVGEAHRIDPGHPLYAPGRAELALQRTLLRDIYGNPFRPLPRIDRAVLARNGGVAVALAQSIYDDRAFDRLPILADALEEAGCTDDALLAHCRGPGPHARGCWVLDLLIGKG